MDSTKKCSKCLIEKDINEFGIHNQTKDGLYPQCKECRRIYTIKHYSETHKRHVNQTKEERAKKNLECYNVRRKTPEGRDKVNRNRRNYHARLKLEVFNAYGGAICKCCGENIFEFLTLDHVNNDGYKHRQTISSHIYNWVKTNRFPEGFQVLCWNCNCGKMMNNGICPHEITLR